MVRHPNEDQEVSPTNPKKETMEYSRHIEALAVHLEESSERLLLPEAHNLLSELIQKIECSLEKNGRYIVELQDLEILKKARDMLLKSREK